MSWLLHLFQLSANVPGKAAADGPKVWAPAPVWKTQVKLLASAGPNPGCCNHLWRGREDGRSLSLSQGENDTPK